MVPNLIVRALFTDESADQTLELTVLDNQRVKCDGHTVRVHVEEVVTCYGAESCNVVAIVQSLGVVEVNIVEGQLLHADFTALTRFR